MFDDSVMIVAHPDDDILWLSSVFDKVEKIVFCFNDSPRKPEIGAARKKTIAEYPLSDVSTLNIIEARSFNKADWDRPVITSYGIELSKNQQTDARYRAAYERVFSALRDIVAGRKNVFTHNPWGEYGHEDHILVYRALENLQAEFDYTLWFSNYCSNRSATLMNSYISGFRSDYECLPSNRALAHEIAEIYKKNDCWTWYPDYQWFNHECLMGNKPSADPPELLSYGHSFPINYMKLPINTEMPKPKPHSLVKMAGKIKGKLKKNK